MEKVRRFNQTFIFRRGQECQNVWDGEPDECPSQLITFATTDGQDGLMWEDWETVWVELGLHHEDLSPVHLLHTVVTHVMINQHCESFRLTEAERLALIRQLSK